MTRKGQRVKDGIRPCAHLTMLTCSSSFNRAISLTAVLGTPSASLHKKEGEDIMVTTFVSQAEGRLAMAELAPTFSDLRV